jgi:hypothetical protein
MRKRHLAVLPIAAALVLGPAAAAPAFASDAVSAPSAVRRVATAKVVTKPVTKPSVKPQPAKPQPARPTGKPVTKPTTVITTFTVSGTLTAIDPATSAVTVLLKGGKDTPGTSDIVTVAATARITLDDVPAGLVTLPAGSRVSVRGLSAGGMRTATKVTVTSTPAA